MSAADRLEDGFPHGTREGYDQGCRGSHCPAVDDGFLSCAQARTRYQSDYAYRKRVDAGLAPAELAEVDEREAAEQRAKLAAARANRVASAPEPEPVEVVAAEPVDEPVEVPAIADERHGTTSGYSAGCRLKERCPGVALVGKSCTQAVTEYQREVKRRRAAEKGATAPVEEPTVEKPAEPAGDAPALLAVRDQLAKSEARVAELEGVLSDREQVNAAQAKLIAELTDRVASLELELDVAKSAARTTAAVERRQWEPVLIEQPSGSRFRFARDTDGGVVVDVEGQQPGFVRFEVDEAGTLTGVAVQSGK